MCAEHELAFVYDNMMTLLGWMMRVDFSKIEKNSSSAILAPQDTCMIQTSFANAVRSQASPGS